MALASPRRLRIPPESLSGKGALLAGQADPRQRLPGALPGLGGSHPAAGQGSSTFRSASSESKSASLWKTIPKEARTSPRLTWEAERQVDPVDLDPAGARGDERAEGLEQRGLGRSGPDRPPPTRPLRAAR